MKYYLIVSLVLITLIVFFLFFLLLLNIFGTPTLSSVFASPITDEVLLEKIVMRIDDEDVPVTVSPNGIVQVKDADTARRMRVILISEGLVPETIDPWVVFDKNYETIEPVFSMKIKNENELNSIVNRLNKENVVITVTPECIVKVKGYDTACKMRTILISEDLLPSTINPWEIFGKERWTLTGLDQNINKQRFFQEMIEEHIKAFENVENVVLKINWGKERLFKKDEEPKFVTVIITPEEGLNIIENNLIMNGIQKLIKYAVPELLDENILIFDDRGNRFNYSN